MAAAEEPDPNPMYRCEHCRSYHVDPTSFEHHAALRCKAPCQFKPRWAHTPAPWHIESQAGRSYYVAEGNVHVGVFGFPERRANAEANARLIVAAPKMFEALWQIQHLQPLPTATREDLSLALGEIRGIASRALAAATPQSPFRNPQ